MASDIYFNGTYYPDTFNIGSYFRNIQPFAFSGSNGGVLDSAWGSRVAEMSGRVRGLSGYGTLLLSIGTYEVSFKQGWFNYIPLVDVSVMTLVSDNYLRGNVTRGEIGDVDPPKTYLVQNDEILTTYLRIMNVTNTGFSIHFRQAVYGSNIQNQFPPWISNSLNVYWHAFGF